MVLALPPGPSASEPPPRGPTRLAANPAPASDQPLASVAKRSTKTAEPADERLKTFRLLIQGSSWRFAFWWYTPNSTTKTSAIRWPGRALAAKVRSASGPSAWKLKTSLPSTRGVSGHQLALFGMLRSWLRVFKVFPSAAGASNKARETRPQQAAV